MPCSASCSQRGRRPERELVELRFRLAQIEHDRRGDREAALDHLKLVLAGTPDHAGAITMLEGMLDDVGVQNAAATLLEPVYAGRGDWKSLIKIGEIRLLQVEDPAERLAWTKRIARLYEEQLEDFDSALRWYGKVFQEAPTERQATEPLLRLADKLDRWQDAARPAGQLPRRRVERGAGGAGHRAPDRRDLRPASWESAPRRRSTTGASSTPAPTTGRPRSSTKRRWSAGEPGRELRELIDEQAGRAADPTARVALLRRSAKLDEEKLDDANRAVGTLREALEVDPTDRKAGRRAGTPAVGGRPLARPGRSPELQPRPRAAGGRQGRG